uniref:Ion transport domain-containing protein n=1 Tax=Anopheles culicifacies TaxID=139723 RepID=A0A182MTJ4_9DIPT
MAALSLDKHNLEALLADRRINIDQKFEDRTALFLLFEEINSENAESTFDCIKLLLRYGANINETNATSVSPIAKLVENGNEAWRKDILVYCLENYTVNVDLRQQQARNAIKKNYPDIRLLSMTEVMVEVLKDKLVNNTEDDFLKAYKEYNRQNPANVLPIEKWAELLSDAVSQGKLKAAQKLVEKQIVDGKYNGEPKLPSGLLVTCCNRGNVPMLEWLLKIIPDHEVALINEESPLSLLVKQIDVSKDKNKCPFFKSMQILLDDPRIEVDKVDTKKCTALHYAVKFKIEHAQELLLAKGAYIGGSDLFGDSTISDMDSFMLERHLDSCVTSNKRKTSDEDYEVKISLTNFIPPAYKPNYTKTDEPLPYEDEMQPIVQMAKSSNMKRLLRHPVISTILLQKWLKLVRFFYFNLVMCTIFSCSFTVYVVFCYGRDDVPFKVFAHIVSIVGWIYLVFRELIQFLLNRRFYIRSLDNYLEVSLILTSGAVLLWDFDDQTRRVVSSCVILLCAVEFTLLVGTLPFLSISTHMVMLKTVSRNFLKCLVLYSIILLAFALSFYTLFRPTGSAQDDGDDDQFNQFGEVPLALVKIVVMFTGEFEAANIKFQQSSLSYVIFTLFLFFVSIVLFNLINGLAVSDTAAIKAESEIISIMQKVFLINKYENALKQSTFIKCVDQHLKRYFSWNSLQLFSSVNMLEAVAVKPNKNNAMFISIKKPVNLHEANEKVEDGQLLERTPNCFAECCTMTSRNDMGGKVVKYAQEILKSRQENVESIEYRMSRMEQHMESMVNEQKELNKLLKSFATTIRNPK